MASCTAARLQLDMERPAPTNPVKPVSVTKKKLPLPKMAAQKREKARMTAAEARSAVKLVCDGVVSTPRPWLAKYNVRADDLLFHVRF